MKQVKLSTMKFSIPFYLMLLTCFLFSCKENNATAQKNTPAVTAPKIDIHTAVITGNAEAIKQHIAAGSNLNKKDAMGGSSPLISACLYEKKEIAQLLIDAGADINFKNNDGSTPLHIAAFFCKPEMVKLLLEKKASKTVKNNYSSTAYETVATPYASVETIYEQMKQMLEPMGVKLDLAYIEKTRPAIAAMLK